MNVTALRVPPAPFRKTETNRVADTAARAALSPDAFEETLAEQATGLLSGLGRAVKAEFTGEARARRTVAAVKAQDVRGLSDAQLRARTAEFRARLAAGETPDDLLVEAFAVAREAARRVTGLEAYDEQILGGVYAHQGAIVDMKTGEGKTLMEVMPVYLHALAGHGVHVVTANPYLAQRDRDWMGPVFESLGLTTGVVLADQDPTARRQANQADVTYGTASEFGFQYLTDNLAIAREDRMGRDLSKMFVLVDEADSLLLDEARTPLIIADRIPQDGRLDRTMAAVVKHLGAGDIGSEPARRTAWLTEAGLEKVGRLLGVDNLYDEQHESWLPALHSAVQARALYQRNVHYVVQEGEVVLVDEFTGRLKPGHRFAEGLHQAIEAAEGLAPGPEQKTMAAITYPNYFRLYGKVSGMTGTGASAAQEFREVFGLPVREVPTHRPRIRVDGPDRLFETSSERDAALIAQAERLHREGRPVLIGSRSIERSEELSAALTRRGLKHQVLNALNAASEAEIIAGAGQRGAITIATNMAGRGVDIKLGEGVRSLGGLAVLLSERHEARRIDEQFIGRAGRQGDPGSSECFLSREDELFRLHGDGQFDVHRAQAKAEARDLDARQELLKYDGVVNHQRLAVYAQRDAIIEGEELDLEKMVARTVESACTRHFDSGRPFEPARLAREASYMLGGRPVAPRAMSDAPALRAWLGGQLRTALAAQQAALPAGVFGTVLRSATLEALDGEWATQQTSLEGLREGAWMQSYGEKEPLREYERAAHEMYGEMLDRVAARSLHSVLSASRGAERG